jgi:hypothetical protein
MVTFERVQENAAGFQSAFEERNTKSNGLRVFLALLWYKDREVEELLMRSKEDNYKPVPVKQQAIPLF